MDNILNNINLPADLKTLPINDLANVAEAVRAKIIDATAANGGHIAASLGAVEIAIALHYCFDTPKDKILWDVGHQAYAHKILTGRAKHFDTLREMGGISGFPNKDESPYDTFTVGHSATSISQGLGLACARDLAGENYNIVCVIGDASLANGMSLEAVNNMGQLNKNVMIILNDNEHSISKTVGALSEYLNRILTNPTYNKVREDMQRVVKKIPIFGFKAFRAARKLEEGLKNLLVPGVIFEELGLRYFGPIDGHNLNTLIKTIKSVSTFKEPRIIHVITKKGKGYKYAEENPSLFHGASPFDKVTGKTVSNGTNGAVHKETYSDILGRKLCELADKNDKIVAVSAAMCDGTGLCDFAVKFKERFFDVGIAEEHAVTFSGGLAKGGRKPFLAIYSTFLQRGYDQIIHDVSLQELPVVFCIDRAGLVGEDGPTHHGVFDIAYMRHIPNVTVMAPRDGYEFEKMLEYAAAAKGPVSIRYPRGSGESHIPASTFKEIKTGEAEAIREGKHMAIIAVGSMVSVAVKTADILSEKGIESAVINARFIKPLDAVMLEKLTAGIKKIVTLEEGVLDGGFGSAVLEFIEKENIKGITVKRMGLPDHFIEHGKRSELFHKYHLTADEIAKTIQMELFGK